MTLTGWLQTNLEILRGETGVWLKVSKGTVATNVGFNSERTTMKKLMLGCLSATVGVVSAVQISVTADQVIAEVPRTLYGTGMEDVNHEIYGGLDAQRLFGESFEEPTRGGTAAGPSRTWFLAEAEAGGCTYWQTNRWHGGRASQQLAPGGGVVAIANRGLNGWGVPVRAGKPMRPA